MSHFSSIQCEYQSKNEAALVQALEEVFGKGNVLVSDEGLALFGYHGDDRSKLPASNPNHAPKCNVVIRRQHVGSASNDVGFVRTEDGKYKMYVSDYDQGGNFGSAKQKAVKQMYTANVTKKQLKSQGYQVSMSKDKAGNLKILASKYSK